MENNRLASCDSILNVADKDTKVSAIKLQKLLTRNAGCPLKIKNIKKRQQGVVGEELCCYLCD